MCVAKLRLKKRRAGRASRSAPFPALTTWSPSCFTKPDSSLPKKSLTANWKRSSMSKVSARIKLRHCTSRPRNTSPGNEREDRARTLYKPTKKHSAEKQKKKKEAKAAAQAAATAVSEVQPVEEKAT